jgi:hypothetical protein
MTKDILDVGCDGNCGLPYYVILNSLMPSEQKNRYPSWCNETFHHDDWLWLQRTNTFIFKNESDRNWFLLRWQ